MNGKEPLVLDGGTGSELARRGVRSPVAWSARAAEEAPQLLSSIHRAWLRAGADVLTTNTFSAARFVLEAAGCRDPLAVQKTSVEIAVQAAASFDRPVLLAGSLSNFPPCFSTAAYPSAEREVESYRELAQVLAEKVDVLILEMIEDVRHAERLYAAAAETGLPLWVGVSLRSSRGRLHPYDFPAEALTPVLETVASWRPDLLALMHTPVVDVKSGLRVLPKPEGCALGVYPEVEDESPEALVRAVVEWSLDDEIALVGGCCGSKEEHVRALRRWVDSREGGHF
ncbi:MAG: homocysteine S-methyltransferase family protein [Acidobacteriota bacterium]